MSVLITDDLSIFEQSSKNHRVVTFAKQTKYRSVSNAINELRTKNNLRVRKGTLRILETGFDDTAVYLPRFNNYSIELNVTDKNGQLTNNVDTIITSLKALNKNATITIHNWNKVISREIRHTCGSKMNAVVNKHGCTSTLNNNTKIIKV